MAKKKFSIDDLSETEGPMNSVAKEDAIHYTGAPEVKHLSDLDSRSERAVRAKKQKIKKTTKKADRRLKKQIINNFPFDNGEE